MFEQVIELNGKEKGPISMVLVGVHGNEKCGIEAFEKILSNIEIEKGKLFFAYGNPEAIKLNQRFFQVNLNRMFKNDEFLSETEKQSYEYNRAQFLKTYFDQSDALLDVHASSNPISKPFIICEPNSKGIIEYLPVDLIVSGFDEVEPGGTDYYMNSIGKIGICVECGYLGNPESTEIAIQSIFAFLKARGHITNDLIVNHQSYIKVCDLYLTKTDSFKLSKPFIDFEEISKDQIIGIDGGVEVRAEKDGLILFAKNRDKINEEGFLFAENKDSFI